MSYIISCLVCGESIDDKGENALTKDKVLEQAVHEPDCDIPNFDVNMIDVRNISHDDGTEYTINALRQ